MLGKDECIIFISNYEMNRFDKVLSLQELNRVVNNKIFWKSLIDKVNISRKEVHMQIVSLPLLHLGHVAQLQK